MAYYCFCHTPLGRMLLAQEEEGLILVEFDAAPLKNWQQADTPLLVQAKTQLSEYFAGTRQEFTLPLSPKGTPFQQKVWAALQTIGADVIMVAADPPPARGGAAKPYNFCKR